MVAIRSKNSNGRGNRSVDPGVFFGHRSWPGLGSLCAEYSKSADRPMALSPSRSHNINCDVLLCAEAFCRHCLRFRRSCVRSYDSDIRPCFRLGSRRRCRDGERALGWVWCDSDGGIDSDNRASAFGRGFYAEIKEKRIGQPC
jgi:hypothetical protein